jgi:hypothetical protein
MEIYNDRCDEVLTILTMTEQVRDSRDESGHAADRISNRTFQDGLAGPGSQEMQRSKTLSMSKYSPIGHTACRERTPGAMIPPCQIM